MKPPMNKAFVMDERRPVDAAAASLMVVLCAIWGTQQVVIQLTLPDMAPLLQIGIRAGVASLVILSILLLRHEAHRLGGGNGWPGLLVGALFGLEFVFVAEGLRFTSASHMSIFLYTAPIFAALGLHVLIPNERLNRWQWMGIAAAFAGVVLSFYDRGDNAEAGLSWIGDVLGIMGGAAWGATTVVVRASRLARAPAAVTLWYQLVGGCVLGIGAAVALGQTDVRFSAGLAASLAYQSLVIAAASYLAWFSLLRTYLASRLGTLSFMTPIFGIGFGVAIMNDRLTPNFVLGAILILAGILVVSAQDFFTRRSLRRRASSMTPKCGEGHGRTGLP